MGQRLLGGGDRSNIFILTVYGRIFTVVQSQGEPYLLHCLSQRNQLKVELAICKNGNLPYHECE